MYLFYFRNFRVKNGQGLADISAAFDYDAIGQEDETRSTKPLDGRQNHTQARYEKHFGKFI
jgi:hypothetical protein